MIKLIIISQQPLKYVQAVSRQISVVLRRAANGFLKDRVLFYKRPYFASQKTFFYRLKEHVLDCNDNPCVLFKVVAYVQLC